jgi:DNA-binding beta-propeller fold protein YncE
MGLWVAPAATLGTVINVTGGASDLVLDNNRNLLYLVRAVPYNRIDVFSTTQRRVIASIPTDANPLAAALSPDGNFLYVTCHDASSINVLDTRPATPAIVNKVSLPARPEGIAVGNDGRVLITPSAPAPGTC